MPPNVFDPVTRRVPALPPFSQSGPRLEWVASRYADVREVLADKRLGVPAVTEGGPAGSIAWLRASVSRFTNGAAHQHRRGLAVQELAHLDPADLYHIARRRSRETIVASGGAGTRVDVMAGLARHVPVASMAELLGSANAAEVADAVIVAAAAYFPGAGREQQQRGDTATAQLVEMFSPLEPEVIVARIALMIQACDATAGLIGTALHILAEQPASAAGVPTETLLEEVLRHSPSLLVTRRIALDATEVDGVPVAAGEPVVCMVEAANRDPDVFDEPERFAPGREAPPSMTFGYGYRPCPARSQALMLAAAVVDSVCELCKLIPEQAVEYQAPPGLKLPLRLEVLVR
ncbi:MAG: cytochrome P450 [Acidimicrobiales bacterium]